MSDDEYDEQVSFLTTQFEELFKQASSELSSELLSIVKSNPTAACAEALSAELLSAAQAHPRDLETFIRSTTSIYPDFENITVVDSAYSPCSFSFIFPVQLAEFLGDALHETQLNVPKHTEVSPTNPTLAAALFSAVAVKSKLLEDTKATFSFARQGLGLPGAHYEAEREEIVAIGACLQLAVAGEAMANKWLAASDGRDSVRESLAKLKEKNIIKHPNGVLLLEKTTANAQGNYANDISAVEAWDILFPA